MDAERLVAALERFGGVLPAAVEGVSAGDARWKPADGAWSILEVVRHLGDEEVWDFRRRLRMTIEQPGEAWPGIDPEGWAVERRYNEGNLAEAVETFVREREKSVAWLRGLGDVDWGVKGRHARYGEMAAGELLGSWAAHDALHLRQIAKRMWQMAGRDAGAYPTRYAGEWGA